MKIVLSGVETNNKGAELMLYAILQEIECKWPEAKVYLQPKAALQGLSYIQTSLKLRYWPYSYVLEKTHINSILYRLHLPILKDTRAVRADFFFDGSGFCFSDQCKLWGTTPEWWEKLLYNLHKNGTKVIFLPQAFGPIEEDTTKKAVATLGKYSDVIMPREQVSYDFLKKSGLVDMQKVKKYMDFTSLVEGVFPSCYDYLRNGICIIPNMRMIAQKKISYDNYIRLLTSFASEGKKSGHPVFLLNHEGISDAELCEKCRVSIGEGIESVTNLNALEVKGLIASSYLVITSRFHGLASALNSGVPSLATSWSHKYEELFRDYELEGYVLPLNESELALNRVKELLDIENNHRIRKHLSMQKAKVIMENKKMWDEIWSI